MQGEPLTRRDVLRLEALRLAITNRTPNSVTKFQELAEMYFTWLTADEAPKKKLGRPPKNAV